MLQYYLVFGLLALESAVLLLVLLPLGRFGINLSIKVIGAIKYPGWLIFALLSFFTFGNFAFFSNCNFFRSNYGHEKTRRKAPQFTS